MSAGELTMGVVGTSTKENELRAPIDPVHVGSIHPDLRGRIWLERGYGERFGVPDSEVLCGVELVRDNERLRKRVLGLASVPVSFVD